ncbi:hypothetical protein NPIL_406241, partial [Nephila pilipes]
DPCGVDLTRYDRNLYNEFKGIHKCFDFLLLYAPVSRKISLVNSDLGTLKVTSPACSIHHWRYMKLEKEVKEKRSQFLLATITVNAVTVADLF